MNDNRKYNYDNVFNIGLILTDNIDLNNFVIKINKEKYSIIFFKNSHNEEIVFDLIITDKKPTELSKLPITLTNYNGTIIIISKTLGPSKDNAYHRIFHNADHFKYIYNFELSNNFINRLIEIEFIKQNVRKNKFKNSIIIFNKYARRELLKQLFEISWLLIPFILIILYLIVKIVASKFGYNISVLCWVTYYDPDCIKEMPEELKFLAIFYSIFNFYFYYNYIISIYENMNNDVFQFNRLNRRYHKLLQFIIPSLFFASTLIIFKTLFTFTSNFIIAQENGFINIAQILDKHLLILSDDKLIYYFLCLDICMLFLVNNFSSAMGKSHMSFLSNRQSDIIKAAKKSFVISIGWDLGILFLTVIIINYLIPDIQSRLAMQLVFLQFAYLYINIQTIINEYKFR
jgi:hypothetical protein